MRPCRHGAHGLGIPAGLSETHLPREMLGPPQSHQDATFCCIEASVASLCNGAAAWHGARLHVLHNFSTMWN